MRTAYAKQKQGGMRNTRIPTYLPLLDQDLPDPWTPPFPLPPRTLPSKSHPSPSFAQSISPRDSGKALFKRDREASILLAAGVFERAAALSSGCIVHNCWSRLSILSDLSTRRRGGGSGSLMKLSKRYPTYWLGQPADLDQYRGLIGNARTLVARVVRVVVSFLDGRFMPSHWRMNMLCKYI
jgi:hypothetical protein